jgi:transposase InsO family protein
MKGMTLPKMSTATPAYKPVDKTDKANCVNHIKQNFKTDKPNLVWVSDITYIKVSGRFYYICVIIDIFSRKVIAWELGSKIDTGLVIRTLQKAYKIRKPSKDLIFHSDRGCQYTSSHFRTPR